MLNFISSKIEELFNDLHWIKKELNSLIDISVHSELISALIELVDDQEQELNFVQRLYLLIDLGFSRNIIRNLHIIQSYIFLITNFYIPGLKKESSNDLILRNFLIIQFQNYGLSWIKDIVIRLDAPYAFIGLSEFPIIFAPPKQIETLIGIVFIYHELGHNIFQAFTTIGEDLIEEVLNYFKRLKESVGPIKPEKIFERNRVINEAEDYWNEGRLNELFCDIFASYLTGPVYFFSCIDMSMKMGLNPYKIDLYDTHPPFAVRVEACYKTLLPVFKSSELISLMKFDWDEYLESQDKSPNYDLKFANDLIELLVDRSKDLIKQIFPELKQFSKELTKWEDKIKFDSSSLEIILNKAILVLLKKPDEYFYWEKGVIQKLLDKRGVS